MIKDFSLGLNDCLRDLMVTVTLPENNYTLFFKEFRTVAVNLDARDNYVPKRIIKHIKTWYVSRLGNASLRLVLKI